MQQKFFNDAICLECKKKNMRVDKNQTSNRCVNTVNYRKLFVKSIGKFDFVTVSVKYSNKLHKSLIMASKQCNRTLANVECSAKNRARFAARYPRNRNV